MKKTLFILLILPLTSFAQQKYMIGNQNCEINVKCYETQLELDTCERINQLFSEKGYKPNNWSVDNEKYSVIVSIGTDDDNSYFKKAHARTSLWSHGDGRYIAEIDLTIGLLGSRDSRAIQSTKKFLDQYILNCKKQSQ